MTRDDLTPDQLAALRDLVGAMALQKLARGQRVQITEPGTPGTAVGDYGTVKRTYRNCGDEVALVQVDKGFPHSIPTRHLAPVGK